MISNFANFFNLETFRNKSISISEIGFQNVDFLLLEIFNYYDDIGLISFYQKEDHYIQIINSRMTNKKNILVASCFDQNFDISKLSKSKVIIIDDYYNASRQVNNLDSLVKSSNNITLFYIYRSESFKKQDLYLTDMHVEIKPILSGVSDQIDGNLLIYDREREYTNIKYKVEKKAIKYMN